MANQLSYYLNDINYEKNHVLRTGNDPEQAIKEYNPYIINKCLSFGIDTLLYADEMNRLWDLPKELQYDYFIHGIRKKKRFNPWIKGTKDKDLEAVSKFFNFSFNKAKEALAVLTEAQIEEIKESIA